MTPVITLTTDFGIQGPFVAMVKAVIARFAPAAPVVDLCHAVTPCEPAEAGFWIARSHAWFPPGSVHVAVVDPGVGTPRGILAASHGGHLFLAPDNGILPMILPPEVPLHALADDCPGRDAWPRASMSFHGRDIFAPLAAELAAGRCRPEDLGEPASTLVPSWVEEATGDDSAVSGVVITLDHFGNLITNIDAHWVVRMGSPRVYAANHSWPLLRTYGDVRPGEYLALVNSFGVVEIARAEQSAAEGLGLSRGAPVVVRDTARLP